MGVENIFRRLGVQASAGTAGYFFFPAFLYSEFIASPLYYTFALIKLLFDILLRNWSLFSIKGKQ